MKKIDNYCYGIIRCVGFFPWETAVCGSACEPPPWDTYKPQNTHNDHCEPLCVWG